MASGGPPGVRREKVSNGLARHMSNCICLTLLDGIFRAASTMFTRFIRMSVSLIVIEKLLHGIPTRVYGGNLQSQPPLGVVMVL